MIEIEKSPRQKRFNITEQLRTHFLAQPALAEALKYKIFPMEAPEHTEGDFLVIVRGGFERERVKQGTYEETIYADLTLVSDHYDRGLEIAELLDEAMETFRQNPYDVFGFQRTEIEFCVEDYEDRKYYQSFRYKIHQ